MWHESAWPGTPETATLRVPPTPDWIVWSETLFHEVVIEEAYRRQTVLRMDLNQVAAICEAAMHEYGMPTRIRTDNGAPFAGNGLLGLSKLSISWTKLGIVHERIQPGRPQQNARHERMHRTLKEDTTKPPALTLRLQQKKFDRFRQVFNHERPHEGNQQCRAGQSLSAQLHPVAQNCQ